MNWNVHGSGAASTTITVPFTIIFPQSSLVELVSILGQTSSTSVALQFQQNGTILNSAFIVTSGAAATVSGMHLTMSVQFTTVSYNVAVPNTALVGLFSAFSQATQSFVNVTFTGTYYGGFPAVYQSLNWMSFAGCSFSNHNGTYGPVFSSDDKLLMSDCVFQNNVALGVGMGGALTMKYPGLTPVSFDLPRIDPMVIFTITISSTSGIMLTPFSSSMLRCTFFNNSAPKGSGAFLYYVSSSVTDTSWSVSNTVFDSNSGTIGAWSHTGSNAAVVQNVLFTANQGTRFSAFYGSYLSSFTFNAVNFVNNQVSMQDGVVPNNISTSAVVFYRASATVQSCSFSGNSAPYCPSLLVYNSTRTLIAGNTFGSATSEDTASVCIVGRSYSSTLGLVPGTVQLLLNTFYDTTFVLPVDQSTTATQLNIWDTDVIFQDYQVSGTSYNTSWSAISIGQYAKATILQDTLGAPIVPTASIPGFITFAAIVNINAPTMNVRGRTAFLTMGDSLGNAIDATTLITSSTSSIINFVNYDPVLLTPLGGSSSNQDTLDSKTASSSLWIQNVYFLNVDLFVSRPSVFCCNVDKLFTDVVFDSSTLTLLKSSWYYRTYASTVFNGTSSGLVLASPTATFTANYLIKNTSNELIPNIEGSVTIANGKMRSADLIISGNLTLSNGTTLELYPSHWGNRDHYLSITGRVTMESNVSVLLKEDFGILPFMPLLTYNPSQDFTVLEYGSALASFDVDITKFGSKHVRYDVTKNQHPSNIVVTVTSLKTIPTTIVDDTGAGIVLDFLIPPSTSFACADLFDSNSTQFEARSLSCTWTSPSRAYIASQQIPRSGDLLQFSLSNAEIGLPYYQILPALQPPQPKASIVPLPPVISCDTDLLLDGSLSTGIGSYSGTYIWSLASTNDTNPASLILLLASATGPRLVIPHVLLGYGFSYSFTMNVTNWALITSAPASVVTVTKALPSNRAPQVIIDGPLYRYHYAGNPLVVRARFVSEVCLNSSLVVYEWRDELGVVVSGGSNPSLLLPLTHFLQPGVFTLTLNAWFALDPLATKATVSLSVEVVVPSFFLVQDSPGTFYDSDPLLSVGLRGFNASGNLAPPQYEWRLVSCPEIDGSQARVSVSGPLSLPSVASYPSSLAMRMPTLLPTCLYSNATSFPVLLNFPSPGLPLATLDYTSLAHGTYVFEVTAFVSGLSSQSVNVTFDLQPQPSIPAPSVFIHLPDGYSALHPSARMHFIAVVNDVTGFPILRNYTLQWNLLGGVDVSSNFFTTHVQLNEPTVVIPYSSIIQGQMIVVNLSVRSNLQPSVELASYTTTFAPSFTPSGGKLVVTPNSGPLGAPFTMKSTNWASVYPPVKYQFSVVDPNDDRSVLFLSQPQDVPTFDGNFSLPINSILQAGNSSTVSMIATLTIIDGIGSTATVTERIEIDISKFNTTVTSDYDLLKMVTSLEQALNASDWKDGAMAIPMIVNALVQRASNISTSSRILDHSVARTVLQTMHELAMKLPMTEYSLAAMMRQFASVLSIMSYYPLDASESDTIQAAVALVLSETRYKFGQSSSYSTLASLGVIEVLSSLASNAFSQGILSSSSPSSSPSSTIGTVINDLLVYHNEAVLENMVLGENKFQFDTPAHFVEIHHRHIHSGFVNVNESKFGVEVSFDTAQFASATSSGYIGYHYLQHKSTFYALPAGVISHPVVSVITVSPSGAVAMKKRDLESALETNSNSTSPPTSSPTSSPPPTTTTTTPPPSTGTSASTKTTFSTTTLATTTNAPASCQQYDSTTNTWSSNGCTTATSSGSVTCDCSGTTGAPLTVLFGVNSPSAGSKKGGLSKGAIAAIATIGAVVLLAAIASLIILLVPRFRRKITPYRRTNI